MHGPQFADRMNELYFAGALSPAVIDRLGTLPAERDDARAFVERMFRSMRAADFGPKDLSVLQAEVLAALLSRLLPGNWEGRVPPITIAGRHRKLDQLVVQEAADDRPSATFIDVACGFPPLTTVDTAAALEGWEITGVDRSLPAYLVTDSRSNYAVFDHQGRALYFQPLVPAAENWTELLADWEASRQRFERLLKDLLVEWRRLDQPPRVECGGATLDVDPVRAYERDRLRFVAADLAQLRLPPAAVVRCCNMLMYFDRVFRREALTQLEQMLEPNGMLLYGTDWAFTTEARYFTCRKRRGGLAECEFHFSLDNVAPLGIVPWYTLHDDDPEPAQLMEMVGILRRDRDFIGRFMDRSDALRAEMNLMPRGDDGYYLPVLPDLASGELWMEAARLGDRLGDEFGMQAVGVLSRHGLQTRLNSVGHIAVQVPPV